MRGRNFTEQEVSKEAKVVLISDLLAKHVFPNEEPIGHRLVMGMHGDAFEIIGVVGDIRHHALEIAAITCDVHAYLRRQLDEPGNPSAESDPTNLAAAVRREVKAIDPDQPVAAVKTMDEWMSTAVAGPRYRTSLLGLFALVALILAVNRNLRRDVVFGYAENSRNWCANGVGCATTRCTKARCSSGNGFS